ncbi:MAG: hypothetical protein H7338_20495 [Candidatus Sericytochromatia bacterium]|nr:hypothetical protein [Candidatus Sericytochromatia bacterium]
MSLSRRHLALAMGLWLSVSGGGCSSPTPAAPNRPNGSPTTPGQGQTPAPGQPAQAPTGPTPVAPSGETVTLAPRYIVSTYAGSLQGSVDGSREQSQFNYPSGLAFDPDGNLIVAEQGSTRLRRITAAGQVTTLVGGTEGFLDGPLAIARFSHPINLAIDRLGLIYVADAFGSHRIRRVNLASGVTTVVGGTQGFADGAAPQVHMNNPTALAVNADGSIYVADAGNNRIRVLFPDGRMTTLAGGNKGFADGNGAAAQFDNPTGIALDTDGTVLVADTGNHRIRRVLPTGTVTTVSGSVAGHADGAALSAKFNGPVGLTVDRKRNVLITDSSNHMVRALTPSGQVITLAGSRDGFAEGVGAAAQFSSPLGVVADANGNIYVADLANQRIRRLQPLNN